MKMKIYIPSKERAGSIKTLSFIPPERLPHTVIVVHDSEYSRYSHEYGKGMVTPTPAQGIANVRQWVLEQAAATGDYALFLDDDMDFQWRDGDGGLHKAGADKMEELFLLLESWLDSGFVHVGVSQRAGNNRVEEPHIDIARMNNTYAYNAKAALAAGGVFNRLKVMEDFDMTLTLLRAGFPNRVSYDFCWSQGKSGAAGGCSSYRSFEVQREAAFALAKLHPGLVKVHGKQSKASWDGIGNCRADVVISWKKAYVPKMKAVDASVGVLGFLQKRN
jgi:hypothetical protein